MGQLFNPGDVNAADMNITSPENLTLSATAVAGALTIALKTLAGADPSASDRIRIPVPDGDGGYNILTIDSAESVTISSGSTLGITNAFGKIWLVAFDNNDSLELGIINCLSGTDIYPLAIYPFATSTAEGGAGGADLAQVFYTANAVTNKPYTVLGYVGYESGLTPGTYTEPDRVQVLNSNTRLPGARAQIRRDPDGITATGTTTMPTDNTIPTNTEGNQFMSQSITPVSAANLLRITSVINYSSTISDNGAVALFQDAVVDALAVVAQVISSNNGMTSPKLEHWMPAGATAETTFKVRVGVGAAATIRFNGTSGAQLYGGQLASFLQVEEIVA